MEKGWKVDVGWGKKRCEVVVYISCTFWQTVFSLVRGNCFKQATFQFSAKLQFAVVNTITLY